MTHGGPINPSEYQGTAFCPIHEWIEPFRVIAEPKISPDSRASFAANSGKLVTVQFLCGEGKQQIVTAA